MCSSDCCIIVVPYISQLPLSRQTTAEIPSPSIASNLKPHSERLHDNNALESTEGPNVTIQKEVHEAQIATLQQNVAFLQQKIADSMQVKETEMEKLLVKQEAIREALLKEKDEKHTAQIARITAELTNDHSYVPSVIEPDEMEAKRMQMIKEGMKELHAKEMERVLEQYKKEKDGIVKQCEERIEASRQEIEQLANEKIQEMHSQFMSAHQAMIEQQAFSESSANQWKQEVEKLQLFLEEMAQKNSVLENRHQDLLESHGKEIKEIRRSVLETEKCLNGWKAKAVSFETRLQESEMQEHALEKQYSEKLEVQQLTYLQHEENLKIEHSESIKKLQDEYEKEIAELESKFSSEINVLEESVSEASGNKASLDVAEVHMKSVEKQLKEFRNQEDHLSKLEERHAEEFLLLKQNHETEKAEEIERISTKFIAKIESLEEELSKLIDSAQSQSSKDLIESLKRKHQKEMDDLRSDLDGAHELEINKAKEEMRSQVTRSLVQQQEAEILSLKQQLNEDWNNRLTMALQELEVKLKEEKEVEVSNLKKMHETQMQSVASEVAAEKRVGELLDELQACHTKETELMDSRKDLLSQLELTRRQLESTKANLHKMSNEKLQLSEYSERCVQQINSMNADLNAAEECFKLEKQANAKATLELQESRSRIEVLEAELKCETSTDATMVQNLEAELAQREVEIADLQCSNQSLNADLNLLKQEQKQHSDEIFKLKQEMTSSVDSLTSMLKSKEEDVTALQSKLEFSEKAISDTEIHYNGVLSQSTKELDALQQKMSLQKSIDENASREIEARVGEMENEVFELKQELNAAREDLNIQSQENETLNGKIQDLMRDLETAGKEKDDAIAEFTLLKEEHERQIQNQQENWQKHVTDMEKTIKDLQSKLMTRDAAFCEVQKEFGRQLSEAEIRESSLQGKIDDSVEEKIGLMVTEKSSLEESLSQARQSLSDKLHEKTELEKQLMFHHIELERRLAEKQHLEDLLFEKSRLEHELTTQKEQLQAELKEIESTLRHKQDEFDSDKTEWLKELGEKDKIIQVKNVEVAERDQLYHSQEAKHANDISDLQANLSQKRKDDLESLSCELSTKHQKELAGTTANLEHRHNEVIQVLESNHKTEVI